MEPERWARITDIYHATIAHPPKERATFLGQECHGDESLRKQVEAMVKSHERSGYFLESPAFAVAPELLIDQPTGDLIGQVIGHYRIESLLGVGGMGEVYLARDELLGRKVALKFLPEHLTADEIQLSRFKAEARSASALNHPNILTVYEIGVEGNRQFIATEFIEGITLRVALAGGRMTLHDALEIAVQVASALAAAHEAGVVHRDIKPENIMLRPDGYAKVLDFGIAKLTEQHSTSDLDYIGTATVLQTRPGLVLGTARYMSPEQARSQTLDARSDIWSLGVMLYEMVAGVSPFTGETPSDCIASILTMEPPPLSGVLPEVSLGLESIVEKALRKNKDERYQTTKEMLADLRNLKGELEAEGSSAGAQSIIGKIKRHKRGALLTLAAVILAAAAIACSFFFVAPAPSPNEKSIAVLPLVNTSGDPGNEYFSDGLSEELIAVLGKIPDLTVIGRSSSFFFKGKSSEPASIGKKLGVAHLIEGSVRREGDRVRIVAELIKARDGRELWSETYDRELKDVFAVQSEIAQAVAAQMKIKLLGEKPQSDAAPSNQNLAAYNAVLQSEFYFRQPTEESSRRAISYAEEATRLDPGYALAWAKLSFAWRQYGVAFAGDDLEKAYSEARIAANKAIRLAPDSVAALTALGWIYLSPDLDFEAAEKEFRRALELAPSDAVARVALGTSLMSQGRIAEAEQACREAKAVDPLYILVWYNLGRLSLGAGRYQEAEGIFRQGLELQPEAARFHTYLATLAILQNNPRAAWQHAEAEPDAFWHAYAVALVRQTENDRPAAESGLRNFIEKHANNGGAYQAAILYALRRDPDQMFQWLDKAYLTRDSGLTQLSVTPFILTYRDDPRLIAFFRKLRIQLPPHKL